MLEKIKNLIEKFKTNKRERKVKKACGNICYCSCGEVLNDNSKCVMIGDAIYNYECANCGKHAVFHFGIAPGPIYLEDFYKSTTVQEPKMEPKGL